MKKVLFVLGLAMCTTLAMAQTNKVQRVCDPTPGAEKQFMKAQQSVDYKASIFSKDDDVVLATYNFSSASQVSVGVVGQNDVIDGQVVGSVNCNNRGEEEFKWHRIPDTNYITGDDFAEDYANYIHYIGTANLLYGMGARNGITDNNGFMFISITEHNYNFNAINTYFQLAQPVALNGAQVVDVAWRQLYRKYYDQCFLDYQLNGGWYSFEINVTGVDVEVTDFAPLYYVATLPLTATNQSTLTLRFRVTADGTLPYGYGWAIDDVKVIAPAASARWSFNSQGTINGFYGTLPQGMTVPMSYTVYSRNIGIDTLTGVSLDIEHRAGDGAWSTAFSVPQNFDLIPGDPTHNNVLEINESGFMAPGWGWGDSLYLNVSPVNYEHYGDIDDSLAAWGYGRRGLPSSTIGKNQFYIVANSTTGLTDTLAGYTYTVSDMLDVDTTFGRTVPGYRWANDNGIVPGGSEFAYGFTSGEDAGYVTPNCEHQYAPGYEIVARYNTPSYIPVDDNGDPWVFRGMEIVSSTKVTELEATGARFSVDIYRIGIDENGDAQWYYWLRNATGLSGNELYLVGPGNVAPSQEDLLGYGTAENGLYYATNIFFPKQPAIVPNTSFLMVYELDGGGNYGVARQATRYLSATGDLSDANNYTSYRNDADLAAYNNQFYPYNKAWDVMAYDPVQGSRRDPTAKTVNGYNIDYYPLMRFIVGPKMDVDTFYVSGICEQDEEEYNTYWIYSYNSRDLLCGEAVDTAIQGAVYSYLVFPGDPNEEQMIVESDDGEEAYYIIDTTTGYIQSKVIDAIYINGNPIDLNDSNVVTKYDYSVYWKDHTPLDSVSHNDWDPALVRSYYMITLRNVTDDVQISAHVHDGTLGIREIEDNVNLSLAPNPATSQVRINVGGFTGKANCSILDMSGRVVYTSSINAGETVVNLNGIPAGAYFVRVTNDTFSKVEKLIVR